jgi:hypothetical protein
MLSDGQVKLGDFGFARVVILKEKKYIILL